MTETFYTTQWGSEFSLELQQQAIESLENGKLLFFPKLSFELSPAEQLFLSPRFVDKKSKNISYDAHLDQVKGFMGTADECQQMKNMMSRFFAYTNTLVMGLFPTYQAQIQPARTSFRPVQVSNRKTSYRKDDRLLHVDAFPATPNQGKRILRVFSNINPNGQDRVWHLGEPFTKVAERFLPVIPKPLIGSSWLLQKLGITKSKRTVYDHMMLHIHHQMKKDVLYQRQVNKTELRLPPHASWIVQTDHVSHAALCGQHLLEQTFYLPVEAMAKPELSPLKVLERFMGRKLA